MDVMQESVGKNMDFAHPPHVLLVEDEHSMAKGLEMVMNENGYHVDLAATGQAALSAFGTDTFDLMVADLRLPDIDGMEVIERIRRIHPDTKVIIITGYPSVSSAVKAVKVGVSDYLRKPFTSDEFLSAISDVMIDKKGVCGVVINWSSVELAGLHVDPLSVRSKIVVEATGHPLEILQILEKKVNGKLFTETGKIIGEKSMNAEIGERTVVENTREIYDNVYVVGMAANAAFGANRMGPIFGGMLMSGKRLADILIEKFEKKNFERMVNVEKT